MEFAKITMPESLKKFINFFLKKKKKKNTEVF
jgi:hypothetical protein